jgi:hypothetical protein
MGVVNPKNKRRYRVEESNSASSIESGHQHKTTFMSFMSIALLCKQQPIFFAKIFLVRSLSLAFDFFEEFDCI